MASQPSYYTGVRVAKDVFRRVSKYFWWALIGSAFALGVTATPATSEQFSIKCYAPDANSDRNYYFFTFDTDLRRVILESFSGGYRRGCVTSLEADNFQFTVYAGRPPFDLRWDERTQKVTWIGIPGNRSRPTKVNDCQRIRLRPDVADELRLPIPEAFGQSDNLPNKP